MTLRLLVAFGAVACGLLHAQDVPPPPKPQESGPTLEATMKFIKERLEAVGPLSYIAYFHNNKTGQDDGTIDFHEQTTKVQGNVAVCGLDFHNYKKDGDELRHDRDFFLPLKTVREVKVLTKEQLLKEAYAKGGHAEWTIRVDPPLLVLKIDYTNNGSEDYDDFLFFDEGLANRVAQAVVHVVELCGGGSKDPF